MNCTFATRHPHRSRRFVLDRDHPHCPWSEIRNTATCALLGACSALCQPALLLVCSRFIGCFDHDCNCFTFYGVPRNHYISAGYLRLHWPLVLLFSSAPSTWCWDSIASPGLKRMPVMRWVYWCQPPLRPACCFITTLHSTMRWHPVCFLWFLCLYWLLTARYRLRLVTGLATRWLNARHVANTLGERVLIVGAGKLAILPSPFSAKES